MIEPGLPDAAVADRAGEWRERSEIVRVADCQCVVAEIDIAGAGQRADRLACADRQESRRRYTLTCANEPSEPGEVAVPATFEFSVPPVMLTCVPATTLLSR